MTFSEFNDKIIIKLNIVSGCIMLNEKIGELIKNNRIELGLSQDQLAKLMGFKSSTSIFKIEKGIASITIEQLQEFSKILRLDFEEVLKTLLLNGANEFLFIKMIINKANYSIDKDTKTKLIELANNYFYNGINSEFFQDLIMLGQLEKIHKYTLPFNALSNDKDIIDFCYRYNLISFEYLNEIVKIENTPNFTKEEIENFISENLGNENIQSDFNFSSNENIEKIQKEIINITTEINNIDTVEDIRDIAQLKLNKIKK